MGRSLVSVLAISMLLTAPICNAGADQVIKMSTTTSTQASGLLDVLLPAFTKKTGVELKVIAKGTGAAIRDGMDGNVDVIFVHAKAREENFIADGYGTKRYAVMHNDFVILGPPYGTDIPKGHCSHCHEPRSGSPPALGACDRPFYLFTETYAAEKNELCSACHET